jgi:hypothetical protein
MNSFGAGYLSGRAAATSANPTPTPRVFGQLQDVSLQDTFDEKKLYGPGSAPLRGFRGQRKIEGKAKNATIDGNLFAELYHGTLATTGAVLPSFGNVATVPAVSPYTVTVLNSANFVEDFGVNYGTTGASLKLVTGSPTQGQYAVAAGVYTFSAADEGAVVVINYTYSSLTGLTVAVPTSMQQESPYFEIFLGNPTDGGYGKRLFKCSSSKLNMDFKQGDIVIPEFDFSVFDPGTGVLYADYYANL